MRKLIYILIFFISFSHLNAQILSPKAKVSVITCGPGSELFTAFGHSAFRVTDPFLGLDKIYNYGTFNFNAPNFYLNFAKGKLTYQLSTTSFNRFLRVYQYENRWVKSQELNLSDTEVQKVFNFLENNAKPENKDYQYDFFYDNCSTKIEDVINSVIKNKIQFSNSHILSSKTHRDLISDYTTDFKWGKFGIDLALGSVIDNKASKDDYKFLPDYIYKAFDNATIETENKTYSLVKNRVTILDSTRTFNSSFLSQPLFAISIIAFLILYVSYRNFKQNKRSKWLDFTLYFSTGLIGIVVLLLWFATSHTATYRNFNFLWAFAPNLIVAFYLLKSKIPSWILRYNLVLLSLFGIMMLLWVFKLQIFNIALLPLILAIALRYLFIIYRKIN